MEEGSPGGDGAGVSAGGGGSQVVDSTAEM